MTNIIELKTHRDQGHWRWQRPLRHFGSSGPHCPANDLPDGFADDRAPDPVRVEAVNQGSSVSNRGFAASHRGTPLLLGPHFSKSDRNLSAQVSACVLRSKVNPAPPFRLTPHRYFVRK